MPKTTVGDVSKTKQYIPQVSSTPGMSPAVACYYRPIENRNIHEVELSIHPTMNPIKSNECSPMFVSNAFTK